MSDNKELFERPQSMFLGSETSVDDVNWFISAQENMDEFCAFLSELHEEIIAHFGPTTSTHLVIFRPSADSKPDECELLIEIDTQRRPGDFVDKINDFEFPRLNDFPVDLCRYCKHRRKVGANAGK